MTLREAAAGLGAGPGVPKPLRTSQRAYLTGLGGVSHSGLLFGGWEGGKWQMCGATAVSKKTPHLPEDANPRQISRERS